MLVSVDWRVVFSKNSYVDDYVSSFMSVLTAVLTGTLLSVRKRLNKPKRFIPRHIRTLILKKRRLWKKNHDEASRQAHQAAFKAIRTAVRRNISCQELDLIDHPNQAAFISILTRSLVASINITNYLTMQGKQ